VRFHKVSAACQCLVPARGAPARHRETARPTSFRRHLTGKKQGFASQIFYILTLWTTKTSILLLYMRLSPSGGHKIATWTMLAASTGWALLSIVLISVPCNPAQFYTSRAGECTDMVRTFVSTLRDRARLTCTYFSGLSGRLSLPSTS
jgi:hypothetical protein